MTRSENRRDEKNAKMAFNIADRSKKRGCVISGVIKHSKVILIAGMSAEFAQACDFMFATLKWFTPVPGLGPELCHDRGPASP